MFVDCDVLKDGVIELYPFGSFPVRGFRKTTDLDQSIREIEAISIVHDITHPRSPVAGTVYAVRYLDGTEREAFVAHDNVFRPDYNRAVFLKDGRVSNELTEVQSLIIAGARGQVPDLVKAQFDDFCEDFDYASAKRALTSRSANSYHRLSKRMVAA